MKFPLVHSETYPISKRGGKPYLQKLSTALGVLKVQPKLISVNLRSLLINCVPEQTVIDHKIM